MSQSIQFEAALSINSGPYPPLTVNGSPSILCPGLNVEFLGGYTASAFALADHDHITSDIISGIFDPGRLGGSPAFGRFLKVGPGDSGLWTQFMASDISNATTIGKNVLTAETQSDARYAISAAAATHEHTTAAITQGVFPVERLGSGASSSTHVLVGNSTLTSSGQWKTLSYTDVGSAAGYASSTAYRIPYWGLVSGRLETSPLVYDPFYSRGGVRGYVNLGTADLGTSGNLYFTDIGEINEADAVNFKSIIYRKIKAVLQEGDDIDFAYDDGNQLITLQPTGGSGSTPTTSPADTIKVWVVNSTATGGDWYTLTGDNVYAGA